MSESISFLDGFEFNIGNIKIHLSIPNILPYEGHKIIKFGNYFMTIVNIKIIQNKKIHDKHCLLHGVGIIRNHKT